MTMGRASVLLVLVAVVAASCTGDTAPSSVGGGSESTGSPSQTPSISTPVHGSAARTMNVTCDGRSTSIGDRTVQAEPEGVTISIERDKQETRLVFDGREGEILIVGNEREPINLAPGRHTVGCLYEGDLVFGEETFEVVDPGRHYIDPLADCRIAGMADFEPIAVPEEALLRAAARTWEVRVDQIVAAGYPGSPHERAFVAYGGPAGTTSPIGVVWFESQSGGMWRSTGLVSCEP